MRCETLDQLIFEHLSGDLASSIFLEHVITALKSGRKDNSKIFPQSEIKKALTAPDKKIDNLTVLLADTDSPALILRQIE